MKAGPDLRAQAERINAATDTPLPPQRPRHVAIDATERPMIAILRDARYRLVTWHGGQHFCDRDGQQWMTLEDFARNEWVKIE